MEPATEFNTNVPDKDERKKIRRKRIEKRNATDLSSGDQNVEISRENHKTGQSQVADSVLHLDKVKHAGIKEVTKIRVITDEVEAKRRVEDEGIRRDRLSKLQQEALSSAKANAAIEMKWAELLEKEIPQELHHEIQQQMSSCSNVIKSKDNLISEFQRQLRAKDEEYVRTLRQQSEDIESLLQRIRKEFKDLQGEYDKEIDAIEDAYLEEREKIIGDHVSDIEALFDARRVKETTYKEQKQKREDQCQKDIDQLIARGADQYNKLKIELEMNIQTLKQQLEEIRATYQLNTEKLDYNYRVLTELDVEKHAELSRYKRRLTRLKDQLNILVSKFNEMESSDTKINNDLTEDYRRLTRKYKDLQAKFRHFEISDTRKYEEVWGMHEEEAKDMVDQLLKADKIITEQQLGLIWKPPDMQALQGAMSKRGTLTDAASADATNIENGEEHKDSTIRRTVSGTRIRAVLKLLATEAGFLLNPEVQQKLAELPDEEAELTKAEALLKALGVKSEEKVNSLVAYFFKDNAKGFFGSNTTSNSEGDGDEEAFSDLMTLQNAPEDAFELRDMIRAEDVIAAIRAYMEDTIEAPVGAAAVTGKGDTAGSKKRMLQMKLYWDQLAQVVNDDTVAVWTQLEHDCQNLKEILTKRTALVDQVDSISAKNAQLKKTLNRYLGDRKNDYMQIPPAQTMRVRNFYKNVPSKVKNDKTGIGKVKGGGIPLMSQTR